MSRDCETMVEALNQPKADSTFYICPKKAAC